MSSLRKQDVKVIFCADIHLQHTPPPARSNEESWYEAMARPLRELRQLSMDCMAPIVCAGDIFDKHNSNPRIINFAINELPLMYAIPGQHDLPHHNTEDIGWSAYWTLVEAGTIIDLDHRVDVVDDIMVVPVKWKDEIPRYDRIDDKTMVVVAHSYVWQQGAAYPGAPIDSKLTTHRDRLKGWDVAVFGDNHIGFTTEVGYCKVVNCLLPGNRIQGNVQAISRSFYSGQAVEFRTRGGMTVRVTANHPILTMNGFVPAGKISKGDQLLQYVGETGFGTGNVQDENDSPPLIEDVFSSFSQNGFGTIRPASVEDFHGDAMFIQGNIDVVVPNWKLLLDGNARYLKYIRKSVLKGGTMGASQVAGSGSGNLAGFGIGHSPATVLGVDGLCNSLRLIHTRPHSLSSFGNTTQFDSLVDESRSQSSSTDFEVGGDLFERFTGLVTIDQVVDVRKYEFSHYVYDLQTEDGIIVTNSGPGVKGICISNCGCMIPRKSNERRLSPSVWLLMGDGSIERHILSTENNKWLVDENEEAAHSEMVGMSEFIEELTDAGDDSLDFRAAVNHYLEDNDIGAGVSKVILESMGE